MYSKDWKGKGLSKVYIYSSGNRLMCTTKIKKEALLIRLKGKIFQGVENIWYLFKNAFYWGDLGCEEKKRLLLNISQQGHFFVRTISAWALWWSRACIVEETQEN